MGPAIPPRKKDSATETETREAQQVQCRQIGAEKKEEGVTWLSMERTAQNRTRWRALVEALCVPEHDED